MRNFLYLDCFSSLFIHSIIYDLNGPEEDRTPDPLLAKQVLSQLSYRPPN